MEREYFRKITSVGIVLVLLVLSFFLVKPILLAIIFAIILSFLFYPFYQKLNKNFKSSNLSASIICVLLSIAILIPIWFLTPIVLKQSIEFYLSSQKINFIIPLKKIFPSLFASETFSQEVGSAISSFVIKSTNSLVNSIADVIRNFPTLFLQFLVVLFTLFFALKDQLRISEYIKSLLPFQKKIEEKLFVSSREITKSVIYGQVVIGIIQGLLVGAGFFIFGINNALFLTIIACLAGIFPIIGTAIIWIPVVIFLFASESIFPAFGILFFGFLSATADNMIKPIFISRRVDINPALILIGMVGGLFMFGLLGVILGPLILAYLFTILEVYRDKRIPGIFIKSELPNN